MTDASLQQNLQHASRALESTAELTAEFQRELKAIGDWWTSHAFDEEAGGFYGEVRADNTPVKNANKGIVLNTRILWFFSEAALAMDTAEYRIAATRAYDYLIQYFLDQEFGGVYWELDAQGNPLNTKKQTYAQAFAIYALCSYYKLTGDEQALKHAMDCFVLLEAKTIDREKEGYFEAFTREWGKMDDVRLSDKDLNYPKSMNTHLHVLEAYTTLHKVKPTPEIHAALRYNIDCFDKYLIDKNTWHLRMFLTVGWEDFSPGLTYGHDIECSWLLSKALDSLGDAELTAAMTPAIINIAKVTLQEGIGEHGEVLDAYDFASQKKLTERVWWVQAEALVGFLNAYCLSDEVAYLDAAKNVWAFIQKYQIDHEKGEWLWLSRLDEHHGEDNYKMGFWKGPYHNGRAMLEAIRFLAKLKD
jgi:mannobiose 2-epimerase